MLGAVETLLNCRHLGPSRPTESGSLNIGPGTLHFRTPSGTIPSSAKFETPKTLCIDQVPLTKGTHHTWWWFSQQVCLTRSW